MWHPSPTQTEVESPVYPDVRNAPVMSPAMTPCPTLVSPLKGFQLLLSVGSCGSTHLGVGCGECLQTSSQIQYDLGEMRSFAHFDFGGQQNLGVSKWPFPMKEP